MKEKFTLGITGLVSAVADAKTSSIPFNMKVSNKLIIEVSERLEKLHSQLKEVERENEALKRNLQEANTYIADVEDIISQSQGVAGYHLNGDIAYWDEFDFLIEDKE